jgi:hypothetical protein
MHFFCCSKFFASFTTAVLLILIAAAVNAESYDAGVRITVNPIKETYCVKSPLSLKVSFQNLTDKEILLIDPTRCEACLFFEIQNSKNQRINPEITEGRVYEIKDKNIRLLTLKPGSKIDFEKDITTQYFGLNKFVLPDEGIYYVTAKFLPQGKYHTKDGRQSFDQIIKSESLKILLTKCTN